MLQDKPYFTLNVDMADCVYELIFNGVYIYSELNSLPLRTEFPVNHWITRGANTVVLNIYQDKEEPLADDARCDVTFCVRHSGAAVTARQVISRLRFTQQQEQAGIGCAGSTEAGRYQSSRELRPDAQGDVQVAQVQRQPLPYEAMRGIGLLQEVSFVSALPQWKYLQAQTLPALAALSPGELEYWHQDLYSQYAVVQSALLKKDIDRLMRMCAHRNAEMDAAYYLPPGTRAAQLRAALTDAAYSNEQELVSLMPDFVGIETMPNRKLVRMTRASGAPAIAFNYRREDISRAFEFIFGKQNDQWIVCR